MLEKFTKLYSLQKTLRFEAKPYIPEGLSEDERLSHLERFWDSYLNCTLYENDKNRNESYPIVKELLDIFHRRFIEDALETFVCNYGRTWDDLYELYVRDKKSKDFARMQKSVREDIVKHFHSHPWWSEVSSNSNMIDEAIPNLVNNDDDFMEEVKERLGMNKETVLLHLSRFKSFSVYFGKFQENRDNMYKSNDQGTSIANRIVNENFPKFAENIAVYKKLKDNCQQQLNEVETNLVDYLKGRTLDEVFVPSYFSFCLTQKGIANYNWLLGANPNEGILGVNSIGNEFLQHNSGSSLKLKDLRMTMLFKQILSDRENIAYIPEQFANGKEGEQQMIDAITTFTARISEQHLFDRVKEVFSQIASDDVDLDRIYVVGNNITTLSKLLYGSWNALGEALRKEYVTGTTKKAKQEHAQDLAEWIEKKCYSLAQIISVEQKLIGEHTTTLKEFLTTLKLNRWNEETKKRMSYSLIESCIEGYSTTFMPVVELFIAGTRLSTDDKCKELIKEYLDSYMNLLHACELFRLGGGNPLLDKDSIYTEYDSLFESNGEGKSSLTDIIPLYNKVRSFLTRKVRDEGKMLLKFDCPTLADGWDSNMEQAYNTIILTKDDKYYLLLLNPRNKPNLKDAITGRTGYKKLVYHQIGNVAADIPNLMVIDGVTVKKNGRKDKFSGSNIILENLKNQYLPANINRIRKSLSYSKHSDTFNKEDLHTFIAYYMQRLIEYKQGDMEFRFKDATEYESYADFLEDVGQQKFCMTYVDFDESVVLNWVSTDKAFLFQIHNKDFQQGSHGTENMHTLYWREIFSTRNRNSLMYKLNGNAEFFYRRKILSTPFTHKKSSILVNKTYANGTPVASEDYKAFVRYFNREEVELTDEQVKLLPQVKTNRAKIDIIKDKRYTEHKFMFHVPITINFKSKDFKSEKEFNEYTLSVLRYNKDSLNIIGIDRGERNLIYVSVINQKGENLIPPRHYNIIETSTCEGLNRKYNYLAKLKQVEGDRDKARKNWTTIGKIKDLKSGYLSQVIHEISKLVVKYNAIVVLEDLNFGFKRGRFNVERQVYQNFEKMLIQKLNFLVFKRNSPSEQYGNITNGLQLTAPFASFKDLGKQSGMLFYVPAEYTSKIDAQTGFVNLFNMKKAASDPKAFFREFNSIEYKDGLFFFSFDYRNGNLPTVISDYRGLWTLASHGERIAMMKNTESQRMEPTTVDLTESIKEVFKGRISLEDVSVKSIVNHNDSEKICKDLFYRFKLLLQMRNSMPNDAAIDYLISPVASEPPFLTGKGNPMGINDADANGAYHIALKGLYLLANDFPQENGYLQRISTAEWLRFVQMHEYREK